MSILGALQTAVSGLSAQSYALENISGNIANSSTVGYKRVDTSFVDLIADRPLTQQLSGTVSSQSQLTTPIQGGLQTTGISTNAAISGDGFFVVSRNIGSTGTPTFSSANFYTRRGDFARDAQGYLTNGSGYYLSGTNYDASTGSAVGSANSPIKIPSTALVAKATTTITYGGNLPTHPRPAQYSATTANSELLDTTGYTTTAGVISVTGAQEASFLTGTIAGGETTVYNAAGAPQTVQLRWGKTAAASGTTSDTWQLFYETNSTAGSADTAWKSVGTPVTFDASGKMTSATKLTVSALTVDGTNFGDVTLDMSGGLTQYSDTTGNATVNATQNGYTAGTLNAVSIASDGTINGSYSNGQVAKLGQISVAHFLAADELKSENGGAYSQTSASGTPTYGLNGSTLTGSSVEGSNTDISDEFSKMIVTQQAYSANTKVMSTAQQMLQDVINIVR